VEQSKFKRQERVDRLPDALAMVNEEERKLDDATFVILVIVWVIILFPSLYFLYFPKSHLALIIRKM
jgi:hypothetical protein